MLHLSTRRFCSDNRDQLSSLEANAFSELRAPSATGRRSGASVEAIRRVVEGAAAAGLQEHRATPRQRTGGHAAQPAGPSGAAKKLTRSPRRQTRAVPTELKGRALWRSS